MSKSTTSPSSLRAHEGGELAADVAGADEGDLLAGAMGGALLPPPAGDNGAPGERGGGNSAGDGAKPVDSRPRARVSRAAWSTEDARAARSAGARAHRARRALRHVRGQGPRQLHDDGRPALHRRHRSHQRVRSRARHDPVQGPGAEPARRLVVREDARRRAEPHRSRVPDPNVLECVECTPLPVEMVVRAYITGVDLDEHLDALRARASACSAATRSPRACGRTSASPRPILTPSTKAPKGEHDVSRLARGDPRHAATISAARLRRRRRDRRSRSSRAGSSACAERGLILVDTKYEFGKDADGEHRRHRRDPHARTRRASGSRRPTRERFAAGEDPEPLDKEYVRRYSPRSASRATGRSRRSRTRSAIGAAQPLHRSVRADHRRGVRARPRRPGGAHPAQPRRDECRESHRRVARRAPR